mmetsp:Transcript_17433/g.42028  ORF Transcript_17433/g.42028 Transcript_17433/m.42028 type:complete len:332 (+) Transcript_17433:889-1884(+)
MAAKCNGVEPILQRASVAASSSSRLRQHMKWPWYAASARGVMVWMSFSSILAPASLLSATTLSALPARAARCIGVRRSLSSASTFAPSPHSIFRHATCPSSALMCSAERSRPSTPSMATLQSASALTPSRYPRSTALIRGRHCLASPADVSAPNRRQQLLDDLDAWSPRPECLMERSEAEHALGFHVGPSSLYHIPHFFGVSPRDRHVQWRPSQLARAGVSADLRPQGPPPQPRFGLHSLPQHQLHPRLWFLQLEPQPLPGTPHRKTPHLPHPPLPLAPPARPPVVCKEAANGGHLLVQSVLHSGLPTPAHPRARQSRPEGEEVGEHTPQV